MKKAISSFVATVLLIGFTVAVGAILSVWFTTFTRTQTTTVQSGAACASNPLYVRAIGLDTNTNTLTLLVSNSGPDSVTITSAVVTCAGALVNSTNPNLPVSSNSQNTTTIKVTSSCSQTNLGVILTAVCGKGGTTSTACPEGTCFS